MDNICCVSRGFMCEICFEIFCVWLGVATTQEEISIFKDENLWKSKPILMTICWRFMPLLNSLKLRPTNSLWRHHLLGFRVLLRFSYIYWYAFKWCGCMINKMAWLLILLFSPSFTLIFCKMWYSFFQVAAGSRNTGWGTCCWCFALCKPRLLKTYWRLRCMLKTELYAAEDWVVCWRISSISSDWYILIYFVSTDFFSLKLLRIEAAILSLYHFKIWSWDCKSPWQRL